MWFFFLLSFAWWSKISKVENEFAFISAPSSFHFRKDGTFACANFLREPFDVKKAMCQQMQKENLIVNSNLGWLIGLSDSDLTSISNQMLANIMFIDRNLV